MLEAVHKVLNRGFQLWSTVSNLVTLLCSGNIDQRWNVGQKYQHNTVYFENSPEMKITCGWRLDCDSLGNIILFIL